MIQIIIFFSNRAGDTLFEVFGAELALEPTAG